MRKSEPAAVAAGPKCRASGPPATAGGSDKNRKNRIYEAGVGVKQKMSKRRTSLNRGVSQKLRLRRRT
jgi:hypothetical protein